MVERALGQKSSKERKSLLLLSLIGSFVAATGSLPTEIPFLGITFSGRQTTIAWFLWAVLLYFLLVFSMRAFSQLELRLLRIAAKKAGIDEKGFSFADFESEEFRAVYSEFRRGLKFMFFPRLSHSVSRFMYLEFWFPIIFGLISLGWLLWRIIWGGFQPVVL